MTKEELQKIYNYENSNQESHNMSAIRSLIHSMAHAKGLVAYYESTHKEIGPDRFYDDDPKELSEWEKEYYTVIKQANDALNHLIKNKNADFYDARENLNIVMRRKDPDALKEYLDLIQKDAKEKLGADKTPLKNLSKGLAGLSKSREEAEVECIQDAQTCLYWMVQQGAKTKSTEKQ